MDIRQNLQVSLHFSYDDSTGIFTVPAGGAGYYYFHTNLVSDDNEVSLFDIEVNGEQTCTGLGDSSDALDYGTATCSIAVDVQEGKACISLEN